MEMYRSGRNEADSKSVVLSGTGGSNPSISAIIRQVSNEACRIFIYHLVDINLVIQHILTDIDNYIIRSYIC